MDQLSNYLYFSVAVSIITNLSIIFFFNKYKKYINTKITSHGDDNLYIPRFGGVSLSFSYFVYLVYYFRNNIDSGFIFILFFGYFLFIIGFLEDLFQIYSFKIRLFFQFIICFLLLIFLSSLKIQLNIFPFNLLENFFISILFFVFALLCIVAILNSYNFIDGLNGLSLFLGISQLIFLFLILNEYKNYQDLNSFIIISIFFYATTLIFIFPFKKIFLGDGGSYLLAITVITIAIQFLINEIINIFILISIFFYPILEISFTVLRRFYYKKNIFAPDRKHLHHIIYIKIEKLFSFNKTSTNNISSLILMIFILIYFSILFFVRDNYQLIYALFFSFTSIYLFLYYVFSR